MKCPPAIIALVALGTEFQQCIQNLRYFAMLETTQKVNISLSTYAGAGRPYLYSNLDRARISEEI